MWKVNEIIPKELTYDQKHKYSKVCANWTYLAAFLATGATKEELGILLKLELEGKHRDFIITRLLGKLCTCYREYLYKELVHEKTCVQNGADVI